MGKWYCYACGDYNFDDEKNCIFCGEISIAEYCKTHDENGLPHNSGGDRPRDSLVPVVRGGFTSSLGVRVRTGLHRVQKVRPRPMLMDPKFHSE